jgi:hypothetical protein
VPVLRGLQRTSSTTTTYAGSDERKRIIGNVTFEHNYLNAGTITERRGQTLCGHQRVE